MEKDTQSESQHSKHATAPLAQLNNKAATRPWRWFLYIIAGGLIISALIAIVAILTGGTNEVIQKALLTTLSVMIHALIGLGILHTLTPGQKPRLLTIAALFVTIGSLTASTLGTWDVISSTIIGNLYQFFFLTIIASAIGEIVLFSSREDAITRNTAYTTLGIDATMLVALIPWVFTEDSSSLPDLYYRIIAILGILLGTSALLTAVAQLLYRVNHPQEDKSTGKRELSTGMIVFFVLLGIFTIFFGPFIVLALFAS